MKTNTNKKYYIIEVTETLQKSYRVYADSALQAEAIIQDGYAAEDIILDNSCYIDTDYNCIDEARTCSHCGADITAGGYVINGGDEYCCEHCHAEHFTPEEWAEMYDDGNGDSYWSDWSYMMELDAINEPAPAPEFPELTPEDAAEYVDRWTDRDADYCDAIDKLHGCDGRFIAYDKRWLAIDNSFGSCYVEEFHSKAEALQWLADSDTDADAWCYDDAGYCVKKGADSNA